jgi:hypothetical protein
MKQITTGRSLFMAAFLFALSVAQAQTTSVIPQVVDGGSWLTTIAVTNTGAATANASLTFFQELAGATTGATLPWSLSFAEMNTVQPQALVLPAGTTLFLHTLGTALATTIGWGQLSQTDPSAPVVAYAIFTQLVPGRSDQQGTAAAAPAVNRILVPFDNTNGAVTSIAIANPTSFNEDISVGLRTANATSQASGITLPSQGHISFDLPSEFPGSAAVTGLAEFYSASGSFSMLALKFTSGAFTTAPVYPVAGPPVIIPQQ